ncbi:MAG: hypothetical protein P4M00_23855 [Azospirillaceae bacterium]|nr:hypothetical protein [Azospirillaceae bacterium]
MMGFLSGVPLWLVYLVEGCVLTYTIGLASFILARVGRSPTWSLLLLVPIVNVIALWVFAYTAWPRYRAAARVTSGD